MPTLDFKGKQMVYAHHLSVPYRTLDVVRKKSLLPKLPKGKATEEGNLLIHGDNLDALKALMPRYAGRVNCIYIDPPYNTGNEGWAYNDNVNSELMKRWLEENGEVDREDPERHDKWLCMMWPRLQLLRELLAEDGVIFISIDDNEQHRLRMLMDEIFGEDNFVACLTWIKRDKTSGVPPKNKSIPNRECILVYSKNEPFSFRGVPGSTDSYKKDEEGNYYRAMPIQATGKQENYFYIVNPENGNRHHGNWAFSETKIKKMIQQNKIIFPSNEDQKPSQIVYYDKSKMSPIFHHIGLFDSEKETKNFKSNFGKLDFDFPKPVSLIKFIVAQSTTKKSIILDSFAGSGTTAHAVLALNKEDGGNRKFILVECEDYADSITAERIRRVIKGIPKAKNEDLKSGLGGNFAYCTLGKELNTENLITGKTIPDYDTLARHVTYTATGVTLEKIKSGKDYAFSETEDYRLHMIYRPDMKFLCSAESALTRDMAERIGKTAQKKGKTALVFAPWKFVSQKDLTKQKVTFCQLPYAIHRLFGN